MNHLYCSEFFYSTWFSRWIWMMYQTIENIKALTAFRLGNFVAGRHLLAA